MTSIKENARLNKACPEALSWLLWGFLFLGLTFFDQWTKSLAKSHLQGTEGITLIPSVLKLSYLENRGMAFGMFQGKQFIFIGLCLVFLILLLYLFARIPKTLFYLPLMITGAILGTGALGNLIDRIFLGYVVDFIYFSLIDFPVFNVADIFVVCGGFSLVLLSIFYYQDEDFDFITKKRKKS